MNILTDILSLIKQDKYASSAADNDVIAIGVHEEPDMLGISSPIPYKSVKVINRYNNKSANLHSQVA